MFTSFGNIFSAGGPRKAEHTDTRMNLRKHEIDPERRKKDESRQSLSEFDANDDMSVSARALKVFLENILKSEEDKKHIHNSFQKANSTNKDGDNDKRNKISDKKPIQPQRNIGTNAYAANAYQSRSEYHTGTNNIPKTIPKDTTDSLAGLMTGEDIRRIHTMLDDLTALIGRGLEDLHLAKNDTFLKSLQAAIDDAKDTYQIT